MRGAKKPGASSSMQPVWVIHLLVLCTLIDKFLISFGQLQGPNAEESKHITRRVVKYRYHRHRVSMAAFVITPTAMRQHACFQAPFVYGFFGKSLL